MFGRKRKLGQYPYTYVRSKVMKSLLIKKEDYQKMMKMSLVEITRFLQETEYKKEIDELANKFSGVDLLELAINKNLVSSFNKLKQISPPELRLVIFIYLKRLDIENIKKILRGKFAESEEDEVLFSLQPAGILSYQVLESLWKKESIEAVLKSVKIVNFMHMEEAFNRFKEEGNLIEIESALDKRYFDEVLEFSLSLPIQGKFFREFIYLEMEIRDIMTVLMLKREKTENKKIMEYIITVKHQRRSRIVNDLIKLNDYETIINHLESSKYGPFIEEGISKLRKENTLLYLERDLEIYLIKKTTTFTHKNPLSIQNILDYMFIKKVEAKNLKRIIKGKQLGVDEEFIESLIVI